MSFGFCLLAATLEVCSRNRKAMVALQTQYTVHVAWFSFQKMAALPLCSFVFFLKWLLKKTQQSGLRTYRVLWLQSGNSTGVLYTLGLGPCIGLALHAAIPRGGTVVALAHADSATDVSAALQEMTQEVQRFGASKISLTLIGGRVSAEGQIKAQFGQIFDHVKIFAEKSEMCTLLSPGAVAGGVAGGLVATKAIPSLVSSDAHGAVACAEELVNNIKAGDTSSIAALGGKLVTKALPT